MDLRSAQGATALMFAADAGDVAACAALLVAGADVKAGAGSWGTRELSGSRPVRLGRGLFCRPNGRW